MSEIPPGPQPPSLSPKKLSMEPRSVDEQGISQTEVEAHHQIMRETFFAVATPLLTPLNLSLLVLILTLAYLRLRPQSPPSLPPGPQPIVFKTFTPRTLLKYNGTDHSPVHLAVRGKVYDVSSGRNFYGPGGPYENFAGRDATRGLACQSFDEEMLTKDLDGPLDPCDDLTPEQVDNLNGWIERFDEKYLVVGKLLPFRKTEFH